MSSGRSSPPAFDSHADDYERQCAEGLAVSGESKEFFARGRLELLRAWWRREGRAGPRRILDYGCGLGDVSALLAEYFPEARVEGADPSQRCIQRAAELHASERVRFRVLEGFDEPEAEPADLIHLNGVVHHVAPAQRPQLFGALARRVAPDGIVALFENNPLNPGTRIVMARIPFDRDAVPVPSWEARRRLREAGLRPLRTRHLFFFPGFLRALRPLERFATRLPLGAQYGVFAAPEPEARSR